MLPQALISSYERYKHDTAVVSSWLVRTAKQCGYARPLATVGSKQPQQAQAAKSTRLKGKARKEAAAAAAASIKKIDDGRVTKTGAASGSSSSSSSNKPRYEYVLAIKDFVPLATFIAAAKPPRRVATVPAAITAALNRVISVRMSFSDLLPREGSSLGDTAYADADADAKHSYFVGILERVRDILRPLMSAPDLPDAQQAVPSSTTTNPFAGLLVYEPSEAFANAPDVAANADADADSDVSMADYLPEPQNTRADAVFAFFALMQDALALRARVRALWDAYRAGGQHLAPVAVATNAAIGLLRQMEEEEVGPLVRRHGGMLRFMHVYYMAACEAAGGSGRGLGYDTRERPGDDINLAAYDVADGCLFNAWQFLDAFQRAHAPSYFQAYNGQFGYFDPALDRAGSTSRAKYAQDKAALLEILGEFSLVGMAFQGNPCEDEFAAGVRLMFRGETAGEAPLWLALAAQLFLEALRALPGSAAALRPFHEMRAWSAAVGDSVRAAMAFHRERKLRVANWPASNDAALEQLAGLSGFWADDPVGKLKRSRGLPARPFAFLHRHALYCGLWVHFVRASFHELGTAFAMAWGATVYAGQLYHAVRREGLLDASARWDDMDLLLMVQGPGGFFVGGQPPGDAERDFKNFCLCMGYSAANWVPPSQRKKARAGGRQPRAIASKAGPRSLRTQGDVTLRLAHLLAGSEGQLGAGAGRLTTEDVRLILAASRWTETWRVGDKVAMEKEIYHGAAAAGADEPDNEPDGAQAQGGGEQRPRDDDDEEEKPTGPAAFVARLARAVHAEIAEVAFDYFAMHRASWRVLEGIRTALDARLRLLYGPGYLDDDSQLPFLAGYVFMASSGKAAWPGVDPLELLRLAAPALAGVAARDGRRVQEAAKELEVVMKIEPEWSSDDEGDEGEVEDGEDEGGSHEDSDSSKDIPHFLD